MHQWNADSGRADQGTVDFAVLGNFVRRTHEGREAQLLFKSCWGGVLKDPERTFEPRQFVEMPYYNAVVFAQLHALEFLLHAWPAGQRQILALEGSWVRQQALLKVHPNDSAESLKERYWQALSLGLFNTQVCRRLVELLDGKDDAAKARELEGWLERLEALGGASVQERLASTPSGKILAAIGAATPDDATRKHVLAHLSKKPSQQIAFVLMDLDNDDAALQGTFDSLLASGLRDFKIVVLKAGELPAITTPRDILHFIKVTAGNVVAHLNQVVRQLSSDWVMLLEAGDVLTPGGLLRLQSELGGADGCQAICANEVQRAGDGRLVSIIRPGANLDLLRSRPDLMSRHWLLRREIVVGLGGYSEAYAKALEFDLLLRLIEQQGMGGLAHLDEYLVIGRQRHESMSVDALATLKRHLSGLGYNAQVSASADGAFQIDFRHPVTPQVSILLPVDGDLAQLRTCLASILQRTRYPRYEVIVAGDGSSAEALAGELAGLQAGGRISVLAGEPGASRSQLINQAAAQARGEYLVLLSSRSQVSSAAWIEALLNQALRPEVGVVGCLLHGRDEKVTHAGYALLVSGQVQSALLRVPKSATESALGLAQVRSCQAVSDDCLMVRKDLFSQCGGMQVFGGGDVDLCLRAAEAGLLVIWTPQAQMINDVVPVLGQQQQQALAERWPSAFTTRVAAYDQFGVDVSRIADSGRPIVLEWVSELA
ncbi:Glycosyl transferase family 2 [compost metagenome]